MPFELFHNLFPETAEQETRTLTILEDSDLALPSGEYSFLEMFCNERDCDCRRVFFYVLSSLRQGPQAVIAYGWESSAFYARWVYDDDPLMVTELQGPVLNLGSPETDLSYGILELCKNVLLKDSEYIERLKLHYRMFRERIDAKPTRKRGGVKKRRKKRKS